MMYPLEEGVSMTCEPHPKGKFKCLCKIIGIMFILLLIICGLMVFMSEYENENDNSRESQKEVKEPVCKIELGEKAREEIRTMIQKEIQLNGKICSKSSRINPEQMRSIIKDEIKKQHKVSLKPDFASASAGGMILSASPTWTEGYSYIYFLFIPIRSTAPSPSILLQPTKQAGDCWPMRGYQGNVILQLAARANIVGFTLEHIDPAMSLSGETPEAPKKFSVYGLINPQDPLTSKHLFGSYVYDNKRDDEMQYFRVQNANRKSFLYIELVIESNHGHEKYTCLYRFQVHGFIDRIYHCQNKAPK